MSVPSLFYELLSFLTKSQKAALLHFINTPGLNISEELKRLLKLIVEDDNFLEVEGKDLLNDNPVGSYNWNHVKQMMLRVIRRFIFVIMADEASFTNSVTLLEYYASSGLQRNLNKAVSKINKPQQGEIDFNFHLVNFHIARVKLINTKDRFIQTEYLQEMEKQLDLYFIQNKLLCKTEKLNRQNIINELGYHTILELPEKIDQHIKSSIGIELYHHILKMHEDEESSENKKLYHYKQIRTALVKNKEVLTPDFSRDIYNHLLNFCSREITKGNLEIANTYLMLIDELENKGLLTQNNKINIRYLQNIVVISIVAKNVAKAREYYNKYNNTTIPSLETIRILIEAILKLHEDDFGSIQKKLNEQPHYESYDYYVLESLYIKNYIECGAFEPAASNKIVLLGDKLLKDNMIPENRKLPIRNFLRFAKKLAYELNRVSDSNRKAKKIVEEMEITGCSPLDTAWFLSYRKRIAQKGYPLKKSKKET